MAKRPLDSSLDDSTSDESSTKKRAVTIKTVEKWIVDNDKSLNTATWLKYEKADRYNVRLLKCSVCTRFMAKICSSRNYSPAFIDGSTNLRTSSVKDHAKSDMHEKAMILLKKEHSSDVREYAPIARSLHKLDQSAQDKLEKKFDISYMVAKEGMAFLKMKPLCELERNMGWS